MKNRVCANTPLLPPAPRAPRSMYAMHKKISAKERIVGFYSTGPKIRPADTDIDR